MSAPDKEKGAPAIEAPSLKDVRGVIDPVEHPPSTEDYFTPDGQRWGKVPIQAVRVLSKPELRVLAAYACYANRWRISVVSESTIARELGWISASGTPNRRNVRRERKKLETRRFMVSAGSRRVPGTARTWVAAYLVAPYDPGQLAEVLSANIGMDSGGMTMRQFQHHDGAATDTTMALPQTHIQSLTDNRTEHSTASAPLRGSRPRMTPTPRAKREYETTDVIEERRRRALQALASYQEQERTGEQSV